jgi:peptidoglycan/LPS O-acetylase OafA/YrhL
MAETDTEPTPGQDPEADVPALNDPALAPGDVAPPIDPSPRFYRDWRGGVAAAGLLTLLAGAWLIASPFALDYVAGDSRLNPMIAGALVAFLALVRTGVWRAEWLSLLNVLIGAWLFASGFWLAQSPAATWNAWLLGLAVVVLALLSIDATEEGRMEGAPAAGEPLSLR